MCSRSVTRTRPARSLSGNARAARNSSPASTEAELEQTRDNTRKGLANKRRRHQLVGKIPYDWDCTCVFTDGTAMTRATVLFENEIAALEAKHRPILLKDMTENPYKPRNKV